MPVGPRDELHAHPIHVESFMIEHWDGLSSTSTSTSTLGWRTPASATAEIRSVLEPWAQTPFAGRSGSVSWFR